MDTNNVELSSNCSALKKVFAIPNTFSTTNYKTHKYTHNSHIFLVRKDGSMDNGPEMISERGTILSDTKEQCLSRSVTLNSISDDDQSEVEELEVTTEEPQFPLRRVNPVENIPLEMELQSKNAVHVSKYPSDVQNSSSDCLSSVHDIQPEPKDTLARDGKLVENGVYLNRGKYARRFYYAGSSKVYLNRISAKIGSKKSIAVCTTKPTHSTQYPRKQAHHHNMYHSYGRLPVNKVR